MARMKTFFKYLIWVLAFYVLSNTLIYIGLRNEYRNLKEISNDAQTPIVEINEAQATTTNSKFKGTIKNNTNDYIETIYVKVDVYSKRDINLGSEYYKIVALEPGETKEFEISSSVDNVVKYSVSTADYVDYDPDAVEFEILPNLSKPEKIFVYVSSFLLMWG